MEEDPQGEGPLVADREAAVRRRARRSSAGRRRLLFGVAAVAFLGAAGGLAYFFGPLGRQLPAGLTLPGLRPSTSEEVFLYFADPRWTRLVAERRQIPAHPDAVVRIRALVDALAQGPRGEGAPVLPKGAKLRAAYLGKDGLAVIDFEPGSDELAVGGASGELLTVFSLVHTVVQNVPGVQTVRILVGGEEKETLAGHVKISGPLRQDPQWTAAASK